MADKSPDDDRASKFFRTLHMSRHGSIRDSANAQRMSTFTRQRLSRMFDGNGHGGTRHGADAGEPPSARNPPAPPSVTSESQHTDPSTIYSTMGTSESGTLSDHHKTLRFSRETVATLDSRRRTQRKTMAGKELPADDLSTPADMTRETLLNALRTRFHFGEVYTVIQANNLVAVNPWKEMDVYGDAEIDRYGQADLEAADYAQVPHVFELAERAFRAMYNTGQTQSIVLSGVANAGKSTALQHILTFLTAKSALMMDYVEQWNSDAGPDDERFKLLRKHDATLEHCLSTSIDTIVNAFASAATNGSRSTSLYGSYFSLYYDEVGVIDGAKLDILHFERSRIARLFSQNGNTTNDANFHVFYYFLAGLDKAAMQKWMLPSVETSAYRLLTPLTSSTAYARRDLSSDRKMWTRLEQELDQCKFGNQRKDSIYAMLAAILHLGNIEFTATPSGGVVLGETSRSHVRCAATLLQVGEGTLHKALSSKRIKMTDDSRTVTMEKQLTAEESKETCDDIACFLYECLFQFIVDTINDAVRPSSADLPRLGILHLPGFTDRSAGAGNGFDEFLRNTLDEVVRGLECFHIIREQQNYEEDGIMWEHVDIADNRDCLSALLGTGAVDLLAGDAASSDTKTTGILQMVRDGTTVNQVAMQILATLSDNKAIDIEQSLEFTVHHTSGSATYATKPFLSNRYARISPEVSVPFLESELEMVRGWFRDASKKASVSARFISAVQSMLSSIARDNILFVHCIQPNREKQPGYVDSEYMWQQLSASRMLEYVQVRHQGYPFRISFVEFFRRYDIVQWTKSAVRRRLAKGRNRKKRYETLTDLQPKCVDILQYAVDELPKDKASSEYYQLGLSHIYLSYASYTVLEMIIDERRDFWAREIQRIWRGFHLRKKGVSKLAITAAVPLVTKKKLSAGKPIEGDRTTLWDVDTDMSDMTIGTGANRSTTSSSRGANVDALPKTNHEKGFRSDRNNDDVVTVRQAQQQERNGKAGAWDALDLNEDDFYGDNASSSALDFTATADDEQALELMVWLSMLLGITLKLSDEKATTVHLMDLLEDGKILLRACARLITSLPPEKELLLAHPTAKDRVAMARAVMVNFADMDDAAVFNVEDVLEQRNAHRVIQTLAEFKQATGRLEEAQRNAPKTPVTPVTPVTPATPAKESPSQARGSPSVMAKSPKPKRQETPSITEDLDDLYKEMRKTFMPVDISNLKDLNMKRRRAIEQLLDTERQYVKAMRIVVKFKTYLESRKNVLSRSEFNTMFSCVDQLLELHVEHVLKALEEQTTDTINVGTLFADLMAEQRKSGMRALYTQYSTNLPEALLLVYAKKHGGVMKAYLDKFENELNLDGKRSLNSFLVIPVDYPVKLLRHLKAIDQATPSSSNDKADLETAIISLRSLVARIEDAQEDIDRATAQSFGAKLVEASTSKASSAVAPRAQNGTAQPLHVLTNMALLKTPWRSFICKGSVWEVINPTLVKERTLFLFNDCLLIAKEEGNIDGAADASSSSLPAPKNTIRTVIDLNAMELRLERDSDPMDKISESLRVRKAVHMFESNPRDAIAYLVRRAVLTSSPKAVAEFLLRCGQLNKRQLGKFLGALENREVLVAYLAFFSFAGQRLDVALRLMLVSFRLPGDAKTIDSVLDAFASAYYEANPGTLSSPELVLRLAYTLLMLNTEIQRSRSGTNKPTMNSRDFAKRFKAHDQRGELSDETLGQMYEAIAHDNFVLAGSGDGKGMSISISNIPVRAEIRAFSATVTVSIPKSDDNLRISLVTSTGIKCVPSELTFAESPSATFRIAGAALGKSRIFFVATGRSAGDYSTSDLPQGKPIIVEPAFMSVCFQLRSKMRDEAGRKLAYMFSVANEIQRDNWSQQIQNVLDGLQNGKRVTYGLPLADSSGGEVVDGFVALNGGALIVPSGSKLEMVEAEDTSLM